MLRKPTKLMALLAASVLVAALGVAVAAGGTQPAQAPKVTVVLDAYEKTVTVLGVPYQAWTYEGTVPGPIIRVAQGTEVTMVLRNGHSEAHSIHTHFNGYALSSDGSSQTAPLPVVPHQNDDVVSAAHSGTHGPAAGVNPIGPYEPRTDHDVANPGETATYKFIANEVGTLVYHCHVFPASEHIQRGLMGLIVVYPAGWSWEELPKDPDFGNTKAWVTAADGTLYFEDVVVMSSVDLTSVVDKASVPVTGQTGRVFVANMKAWNDPYIVGPVKTGTNVRLLVVNLDDYSVHSWHVHSHNFNIVDKFDPEQKVRYRTDVQLIGPGESFVTTLVAGQPGFWFMHDHYVPLAYAGMVPWLQVTE